MILSGVKFSQMLFHSVSCLAAATGLYAATQESLHTTANTGPFTSGQPHMINELQLGSGWQVSKPPSRPTNDHLCSALPQLLSSPTSTRTSPAGRRHQAPQMRRGILERRMFCFGNRLLLSFCSICLCSRKCFRPSS